MNKNSSPRIQNESAKATGQQAEQIACAYLRNQGLKLLESNYHCRYGEIDLIMEQAGQLVFVEVRYRKNPCFGSAAESVDQRKQQKLIKTALEYINRHPGFNQRPSRFDVVAITGDSSHIDWISDAFSC